MAVAAELPYGDRGARHVAFAEEVAGGSAARDRIERAESCAAVADAIAHTGADHVAAIGGNRGRIGEPGIVGGTVLALAYIARVFLTGSIALIIISAAVVSIGTAIAYSAMPMLITSSVGIRIRIRFSVYFSMCFYARFAAAQPT